SHPTVLVRVPDPVGSSRKFITDPNLPECPQLRFIRIDGSMFFGAVNFLQETLRQYEKESPDRRHLAIVMSGVNFLDVAGVEALAQEAKRFRSQGGGLYLVRVKEEVLAFLRRSGSIDVIGEGNLFQSKTEAIRAIYARLDAECCRSCKLNVFVECARRGRQEPAEEAPWLRGAA
ncbi:MAG: STAS domain-containing protein, partial [Alphaproteobacteria bacterium]